MQSNFCSLLNKKSFVTGSSSGIGRAIAQAFSDAGAAVGLHCRQSNNAIEQLAVELKQSENKAAIITGDVGDCDELEELVDSVWDIWGGIDIWVNNAGVDLLTGENAKLNYQQKLQRLLDIDVRSTMLLSRIVAKRMMEQQGSGIILNIGWDQADRGMDGESGELFAAAKNAIMGGTRSLAASFAPNVRVNCIAPGWIKTAWGKNASEYWQERVKQETPMKRWGLPEDIANMARFLASDEASYITGQVINVNGGAIR